MSTETLYPPGSLVNARGRDWVVQPCAMPKVLRLRPLGGSEDDIAMILPELESVQPEQAVFDMPDPSACGSHDAARLLRDSLLLKLRAGAGPFRSFGNIAVEPRAYQLVPLLMAMRQDVVRLLIADDVGIGKTIEAGLIIRELLDRGEITEAAFLVPPHLVDQWQQELKTHFNIEAALLTSTTASRLERGLPGGVTLFEHYRFVIVSLDYIKAERHRDHFLTIAPDCIIVDEAHGCVAKGRGRQLRFELLKQLAADPTRHMLMLTATPHSGDDTAFNNLLSLLDPTFLQLTEATGTRREKLREKLATCFVQRRRRDIDEWGDSGVFPIRKTAEITYTLSGRWGSFFDRVQAYCFELAQRVESEDPRNHGTHIIWYATLALLRCAASSPAAAESALTTRLQGTPEELESLADPTRLYDGDADDLQGSDLEPAAALDSSDVLRGLIEEARSLAGKKGDPKLKRLVTHVGELIADDFRPVIFCRYIATAHYVAEHLRKEFPKATIDAVTGEYTPDERKLRVATCGTSDTPILVATDCLSEGINLQEYYTAVVHYDLAWNPTRHEQREGRVDRFGQLAPEVRCTMLYGQDNPIDGFVLNVILRKAESIRKELGVMVSLPENEKRINLALVKAALLKRKQRDSDQLLLAFDEEELSALETEWKDAGAKAKANRTIFAQRSLKPAEVLPEWQRQIEVLGGTEDVTRFVKSACIRLGSPLGSVKGHYGYYRLNPAHFQEQLRERLAQSGVACETRISFAYPPPSGVSYIHRSHPLVSILADTVLEDALAGNTGTAARCAATVTADVDKLTVVYLLRLRHQIAVTRRKQRYELMAEETVTLAVEGRANSLWTSDVELPRLLDVTPSGNLSREQSEMQIKTALEFLDANRERVDAIASERSEVLLADHRRIREASDDVGRYTVKPCLPADVIGVYVLLPETL